MNTIGPSLYLQQQALAQEVSRTGAPPAAAVTDNTQQTVSPSATVTLSAQGLKMSRSFETTEAINADAKKQWHANNARWEAKIERLHDQTNQNNIARNQKNHAEFVATQAENRKANEAEVKKQAADRVEVPPPRPAPVEPPPPPAPPPPPPPPPPAGA
jgi:hypothetical protein